MFDTSYFKIVGDWRSNLKNQIYIFTCCSCSSIHCDDSHNKNQANLWLYNGSLCMPVDRSCNVLFMWRTCKEYNKFIRIYLFSLYWASIKTIANIPQHLLPCIYVFIDWSHSYRDFLDSYWNFNVEAVEIYKSA